MYSLVIVIVALFFDTSDPSDVTVAFFFISDAADVILLLISDRLDIFRFADRQSGA